MLGKWWAYLLGDYMRGGYRRRNTYTRTYLLNKDEKMNYENRKQQRTKLRNQHLPYRIDIGQDADVLSFLRGSRHSSRFFGICLIRTF